LGTTGDCWPAEQGLYEFCPGRQHQKVNRGQILEEGFTGVDSGAAAFHASSVRLATVCIARNVALVLNPPSRSSKAARSATLVVLTGRSVTKLFIDDLDLDPVDQQCIVAKRLRRVKIIDIV
jgi:hypothetical protein